MNSNFQPHRQTGIILSLSSLLLLGILPIISNSRPSDLDALDFAFYLSLWQLISAIPLLFFELNSSNKGIFDDKVDKSVRNSTLRIILITGVIFSFTTFLYVLSFEKAGTVSAAIALQAYSLFSILLETLFLGRKKNSGELLFTILLVTGIYYLGTEGTWIIKEFSPWFALALLVPFLWSVAHVTIKHTLDKSPITPSQVTFMRVLISSIVLFAISGFNNGFNVLINGITNPTFQLFAFFMGVVYYLELVIWFYAIKHVDVSVASSITTPTPIITLILAIIILKESVELYQITAMIVIFICLYGILYFGKQKNLKLN
ncbi:MAG: DMT family transporter [Candidatus Heimdallarchaeota archaeon]|nr:DMT family transporter [Candidatus Heimdallarchaeota archaeon]